jgi:hypothetical protein
MRADAVRRALVRGAAWMALAALPAAAAVDLGAWAFRQRVVIGGSAMVAHFFIGRETFSGSREDFADLRMLRNGVEVPITIDIPRPQAPVTVIEAANPPGRANPARAATEYVLDAGAPNIPQDRVRIEAAGVAFSRVVEIHASIDNRHWWRVAGGTIFRAGRGDSLELAFNESRRRYLRVRIHDGDGPPLKVLRIRVSGPACRVRFPSEGAGEAWLYYGNPDAKAPDYDFGKILLKTGEVAMSPASLGAREQPPEYRPPPAKTEPWTRRQPALMWTLLAASTALLGGASIKLLSGGPEEPPAG